MTTRAADRHDTDVPGDLDDRLAAAAARHPTPGLAVAIVRDGQLAAFRGLGWADVDRRTPVTPDTAFRIGSITKTMTAIAVMQLCEEGSVGLDDPINMHLRATRIVAGPDGQEPTVRQGLTHTTGIGEVRGVRDLLPPTFGLGVPYGDVVPSIAEHYAGGLRATGPAGVRWAYSNHVFGLLGQMVADVAGPPFEDQLRQRLFEPLGMTGTAVVRSSAVVDRLATGHVTAKGRTTPAPDIDIVVRAAGSVYSTAADMARYAAALMGGGANSNGRILDPDSLEEVMRPQHRIHPRHPFQQGLGFLVADVGGHRVIWHDGGLPGFVSSMQVAPDDGVAVLAFANDMTPAPHVVTDEILRAMLGAPTPAEDLAARRQPDRPEVSQAVIGTYRPPRGLLDNLGFHQQYGGEVAVVAHDGGIALRGLVGPGRSPTPLHPVDPDDPYRFQGLMRRMGVETPVDVVFDVDGDGRATTLTTFPFQLRRVPPWRSLRWGLPAALGGVAAVTGAAFARR